MFTGGDVIEDYRLSFKQSSDSEYAILESAVPTNSYLATGLQFGITYDFRVEARNSYSYSAPSTSLRLLCAFKPEPPLSVTTQNQNDLVVVAWD